MSKIPVFVSCPTILNEEQDSKRQIIIDILEDLNIEPRALGRTDYPKDSPLKEVAIIAKRCSGGVIFGFEQLRVHSGVIKYGTPEEHIVDSLMLLPSPWNQIEAGILFGLKLPLLIFKEKQVSGGVFDIGTTDVFVHSFPSPISDGKKSEIKQVVQKWFAQVSIRHNEF